MKRNQQIFYLTLTLLWMALIFWLSSIPDLKSSLPSWQDFVLRKLAHATEYAILYILWLKSLGASKKRMLIAAAISLVYAMTDEFHQGFVHDRVASPIDVLIDSGGVLIGYVLMYKKTRH